MLPGQASERNLSRVSLASAQSSPECVKVFCAAGLGAGRGGERDSDMAKIAIIDGHPDPARGRYVNALADAYEAGAARGGHEVNRINLSGLEFPILRSAAQWADAVPPALKFAQEAIGWADHLVILYPLWLGAMPAHLKGFLEQVTCGGFAIAAKEGGPGWSQNLKGKSARIIVTMGMPSQLYRLYFGAHSLKSLERNILKFAGVSPVRDTLIGLVEGISPERRARILERIGKLGEAGR